jgi:ATP-binding cassette subfamily B protein
MERYADFRWLLPYIRRHSGSLLAVIGLAAVTSALSAAQPYLSKLVIDEGLIGRHFAALVTLCLTIVALAACGFAVGAVNRWQYVRVSGRILFELREDVYAHILTLPPLFFRRWPVGDLVTRLDGDVAEIQRFSVDSLLAMVNAVLLLAFSAAVMIGMSPKLALVAAGTIPLHLLLRHRARSYVADSTRAVRERRAEVTEFLVETLGMAKAVQSAGAEDHERERLEGLNRGLLRCLIRQQLVGYAVGSLSSVLSHMTTAVVFMAGGWQVIHGSLSIGTLVAFTAYLARGTGSATSLMGLYTAYQRAGVSLKRVGELMEAEPMLSMPGPRKALGEGAPRLIRFDRVSFRYPGADDTLLEDLTLEIAAGEKVVLYGESGAGKSTLIDLLRGFIEPESGRIIVDSVPLSNFDLREVRRRLPVLETDPALFRGTVMQNLRYGNFDAPDDRVLEAARQTGVETFVRCLPRGYETNLGARGAGLSTGQRQRIAVARVLLGNPLALVLDEATTNLDATAAQAMHELIDWHFPRRSRIVITHAPHAVPRADRIVELYRGRIIERQPDDLPACLNVPGKSRSSTAV